MASLRIPVLCAAAAAVFATVGPAAAQDPDANQIINSLRPGGDVTGTTRGIRPIGPVPAAGADHAMRAPGHHAATRAGGPGSGQVTLHVEFAPNSADLTAGARRTLDQLGIALASPALAGDRFRIEGHTDTTGMAEANQALSTRRADAVVSYLAASHGIDRARLDPVGLGEEGLAVPTGPNVSEPRNRRVLVVNLGA